MNPKISIIKYQKLNIFTRTREPVYEMGSKPCIYGVQIWYELYVNLLRRTNFYHNTLKCSHFYDTQIHLSSVGTIWSKLGNLPHIWFTFTWRNDFSLNDFCREIFQNFKFFRIKTFQNKMLYGEVFEEVLRSELYYLFNSLRSLPKTVQYTKFNQIVSKITIL